MAKLIPAKTANRTKAPATGLLAAIEDAPGDTYDALATGPAEIGRRLANGRMVKGLLDGIAHPKNVQDGEADPRDIEQAVNLAGLGMLGSIGGKAPAGALKSGFHVPQFDLPRNVPKNGPSARVKDLIGNKKVRDEVSEYVSKGKEMGGDKWYRSTDPIREKFMELNGSEEGLRDFRKYMDFVAATSPRSKVPENVRNSSYYYHLWKNGQAMPEIGTKNPQPYGHIAQRLHQQNANAVAGPGWDPLQNPKPASFVENLSGNHQPVTVDTHAFRLPAILSRDPRFLESSFEAKFDPNSPLLHEGYQPRVVEKKDKKFIRANIQGAVESGHLPMEEAAKKPSYWQAMPRDNEYPSLEQYYKGIGKDLGIEPDGTQASAWVGGGKVTGLGSDETKGFEDFFNDRILVTAKAHGLPPDQVYRDFIRGRMPLLSSNPAAAPALAASREEQGQPRTP